MNAITSNSKGFVVSAGTHSWAFRSRQEVDAFNQGQKFRKDNPLLHILDHFSGESGTHFKCINKRTKRSVTVAVDGVWVSTIQAFMKGVKSGGRNV